MNAIKDLSKIHLTWILIKINLLKQTGINLILHSFDRRIKRNKIFALIMIAFAVFIFSGHFLSIALGYAFLGLNKLNPIFVLILISLITFIFTLLKAKNSLFDFKDYESLVPLPLSSTCILHSRFLTIHIWNVLFSFIIMIPMGIVYALNANTTFLFYLFWFSSAFVITLIPMLLACILNLAITLISLRFKHTNMVQTLLLFILILFPLFLSFSTNSNQSLLNQIFDSSGNLNINFLPSLIPLIYEKTNQIYPLTKLFYEGVVEGNVLFYFSFVFISIGAYLLFISILSKKYQSICTALTSYKKKSSFLFTRFHKKSVYFALYHKTMLKIIKSSVASINILFGCALAIIFSITFTFIGFEKILYELDFINFEPIIKYSIPYVIAALLCMTNTTSISLALEGSSIWLIHSLPISPKQLYTSYILVNLTFTIPSALLCSLLMSLTLSTSFLETIVFFVTPIIFVITSSIFGIFIGNRLAYYDWQNLTQLVKESLMSALGMLGCTFLIVICALITNIGVLPFHPLITTLIIDFIFLSFSIFIYLTESTRPIKK